MLLVGKSIGRQNGRGHLHGPMITYITSKGSVGDYIKRYLDETDASEKIPPWNDLKRI